MRADFFTQYPELKGHHVVRDITRRDFGQDVMIDRHTQKRYTVEKDHIAQKFVFHLIVDVLPD